MRRVTAERDAARGKVEVLEGRVERAKQALAAAEENAAVALRTERQAELARLRAEIAEAEAAATAEVLGMRLRIAELAHEQAVRVRRLNGLERELSPGQLPTRPSFFAELGAGSELRDAAGLPELERVAQRESVAHRLVAAGL